MEASEREMTPGENARGASKPEKSEPKSSERTVDEKMDNFRGHLKALGANLMRAKEQIDSKDQREGENRGEVMANIMLAYRHIEDAAMRLGKVKQHMNGGKSIYDKNVVGSPEE